MTAQLLTTHPDAEQISVLGVQYAHMVTPEGGEMYLTEHGLHFWRQLTPDNWYGELELHEDGLPICCQCNFEFLRGSSSLCRELE